MQTQVKINSMDLKAHLLVCLVLLVGIPGAIFAENADTAAEPEALEAGTTDETSGEEAGPALYFIDEAQRYADIAQHSEDESNWLELENDTALTLYRTQRTAQARGVFLLVGGRGGAFANNQLLNTLRKELPRLGWHTLAVGLPDRPQPRLPELDKSGDSEETRVSTRSNAGAPEESPAQTDEAEIKPEQSVDTPDPIEPSQTSYKVRNTEQLDTDQHRIEKRLRSALALARERSKGGPVVVLGIGEGAAWVSWLTQRESKPLVDPVVLVNFASETPYIHDASTLDLITAMRTPGLILQEQPYVWSTDDLLGDDIELRVLPRGDALHGKRLLRTIRGWLLRKYGS